MWSQTGAPEPGVTGWHPFVSLSLSHDFLGLVWFHLLEEQD